MSKPIDGRNFFDQSLRNNLKTYDSIQNITIGQGDHYTTGYFLDYNHFKNYYKMVGIDLIKGKHLMLIQKQYKTLFLLEI